MPWWCCLWKYATQGCWLFTLKRHFPSFLKNKPSPNHLWRLFAPPESWGCGLVLDLRSFGARVWHVLRECCCPSTGVCVAETEKHSCIIDVLICANAQVFVKWLWSCRDKRQVLWAETRAGAHFVGLVLVRWSARFSRKMSTCQRLKKGKEKTSLLIFCTFFLNYTSPIYGTVL